MDIKKMATRLMNEVVLFEEGSNPSIWYITPSAVGLNEDLQAGKPACEVLPQAEKLVVLLDEYYRLEDDRAWYVLEYAEDLLEELQEVLRAAGLKEA